MIYFYYFFGEEIYIGKHIIGVKLNFNNTCYFNNLDNLIKFWLINIKKPVILPSFSLDIEEQEKILDIWNQYKDLL
jgi:hypothetical protein